MAETDANPMTNADFTASSAPHIASPLKGGSTDENVTFGDKAADAKQAVKDSAGKYSAQATDKVRTLADTGKVKAGAALGQLSTLMEDAATQVDDRMGAQYGDYARSAASSLSSFSSRVQEKDIDELVEETREFVRKSPGIAVGVAAAVGFAVARIVHSGIDSDKV